MTEAAHLSTVINKWLSSVLSNKIIVFIFRVFSSCLKAEISVSCEVKKSSKGVVVTGVVGCVNVSHVSLLNLFGITDLIGKASDIPSLTSRYYKK